jgi:NadR type nicotinamide-nucleotide adenylyltransferase
VKSIPALQMTDSSTTSQSKPVLFKVVVTGSECTGKTTLVQALAARFETAFSTEGARNYLNEVQRPLSFADVEPIARRQMSLEGEALEQAGNLAILDTDLVSTMIYSRHYYGGCKTWITEMAVSRMADLYLVCDIDVPWTEDGLQRDQGEPGQRLQLHQTFISELDRIHAPYEILSGGTDTRLERATTIIKAHL